MIETCFHYRDGLAVDDGSGWRGEAPRQFYLVLVKAFSDICPLVPEDLRTGRGDDPTMAAHRVFSREWLNYWLFTEFSRLRIGGSDFPNRNTAIVWKTTPSKIYRNLGTYHRLVLTNPGATLVPVHLETALTPTEVVLQEDLAALVLTKDNFWDTMKLGGWIEMTLRKCVIHYLSVVAVGRDGHSNLVVDQVTIANHIWDQLAVLGLRVFWDDIANLTDYLKNHLFKKKGPDVPSDSECQFLFESYHRPGPSPSEDWITIKDYWDMALNETTVHTVREAYREIKTGQGMVSFPFEIVRDTGRPLSLTMPGGEINLVTAIQDSLVNRTVTTSLMLALTQLNKAFRESRVKIGKKIMAKGHYTKEMDDFLKVCKDWKMFPKRISQKGKRKTKKRAHGAT